MKRMIIWAIVWVLFLGVIPLARALDPAPPDPDVKAVELQKDGEAPKEKVEQHAPTIEVGDTRHFMREGPLSSPKEDEGGSEDSY